MSVGFAEPEEQLNKLEQKKEELSITVRELDKQMQAEREAASKKDGAGVSTWQVVFCWKETGVFIGQNLLKNTQLWLKCHVEVPFLASQETTLKTELAGVEEALTSSRKETGQVLSDLKESRKDNAALKDKVRDLDQSLADSKVQQEAGCRDQFISNETNSDWV